MIERGSYTIDGHSAFAVHNNGGMLTIESGTYYTDAVQWVLKNGVMNGISVSAFSPDASCTRTRIVTFLQRILAA